MCVVGVGSGVWVLTLVEGPEKFTKERVMSRVSFKV